MVEKEIAEEERAEGPSVHSARYLAEATREPVKRDYIEKTASFM
jgi:hypothetical protein